MPEPTAIFRVEILYTWDKGSRDENWVRCFEEQTILRFEHCETYLGGSLID